MRTACALRRTAAAAQDAQVGRDGRKLRQRRIEGRAHHRQAAPSLHARQEYSYHMLSVLQMKVLMSKQHRFSKALALTSHGGSLDHCQCGGPQPLCTLPLR